MKLEWVEQKEREREERAAAGFKSAEMAVRSVKGITEDEVNIIMAHIRKMIKIGLCDKAMMFPYGELMPVLNKRLGKGEKLFAFEDDMDKALGGVDFYQLFCDVRYNYWRYLDSEPVEFDGDIIITDPCYITKDDDWDKSGYGEEMDALPGITKFLARGTIYGDWSCTVYNLDTEEEIGSFCADAGMVCVCLTDEVLSYNSDFREDLEKDWVVAQIKDFKGKVWFEVDEEKWTDEDDGREYTDYGVHVIGCGINKRTGEPLRFKSSQTGL